MFLLLALLAPPTSARTCGGYGPPTRIAAPAALAVTESSGLAAAHRRPGVLYTHDDSGNAAVLHALTISGEPLGAHPMPHGWVSDWEDVAAGPCPADSGRERCLYIGDIGDNKRSRDHVLLRIVAEPEPDAQAGAYLDLLATWRFRYPDGQRNAEALLVHPTTGQIDVVTKTLSGSAEVYRVPAPAPDRDQPRLLDKVGTISISEQAGDPLVTGGAWDADGDRVVLRTYTSLMVWTVDPCARTEWWQTPPLTLDAPTERQGEAVTVGLDGHIYTSSEGHPMALNLLRCLRPEPAATCDAAAGPQTHKPTDPAPPFEPTAEPLTPEEVGCGCANTAGPLAMVFCLPVALVRLRRRHRPRQL